MYSLTAERTPAARNRSFQDLAAVALMLLSLLTATLLKPTTSWYRLLGRPNYEQLIPKSFGEWVTRDNAANVVPPLQADSLKSTYSQIVSRTYVHKPSGRIVMLSIAYDDVQIGERQIHRPESCYSSQGFTISGLGAARLSVSGGYLEGFRMSALEGDRNERVTYWIRVGNRLIAGPSYTQSFARMAMSLKGASADALLVRVSEISHDPAQSDALQEQFVADLLDAVAPDVQYALIGRVLGS